MLARNVAVIAAYGIGGRKSVVRQLVVFRDLTNKSSGRLPCGKLLAKECVEYCTGGIKGLKLILNIKGGKDILGVSNGKVRAISVIGGAACFCSGDYIGITLDIALCKAECGTLRRSRISAVF